jgi:hypothetical protein
MEKHGGQSEIRRMLIGQQLFEKSA